MNELVVMKNQQAVTTSLVVAEAFKKNHKDVMRAISNKLGSAQKAKNIQYRTYQRLILSILLLLIIHHTYQTPTRYILQSLKFFV